MKALPFAVTIIVVTHNRPALLKRALDTMALAINEVQYPVEVKLLINGADSGSWEICEQFKSNWSKLNFEVKSLSVGVTPAEARNILVSRCSDSNWFFFMDDDVQIPIDILKRFENLCLQYPEYEAWGGPNLTPQESNLSSTQNGWFVENFFIVGPVSSRYRKRGRNQAIGGQFNLMLCNLFVKAYVFKEEKFAVHLKTAEENDLIYRMQSRKRNIGYSDDLYVWHERRGSLKSFFRQIFYYGFGRGQLLVSGSFISQWCFAAYPFALLFAISIFLLNPIVCGIFLTIWLLGIQIFYFRKFRKIQISTVLVPVIVWGLYSVGILKGFWDGFRNYQPSKNKGDLEILIKN